MLSVGCADGHGSVRRKEVIVTSNLPLGELKQAYEKGTAIVGFDLSAEVCTEYEENTMEPSKFRRLQDLGLGWQDGEDPNDTEPVEMYEEAFVEAWLFVCKLGNPKVEAEVISETMEDHYIGGYGLGGS